MHNAALRKELRKQHQSTNGNKSVMVQRLRTRVMKRVPGNRAASRTKNNTEEGEDAVAELVGFPATARWKALVPLQEVVLEEQVEGLRAPTVHEGEVSIPKFNFGEPFDCEPFTELCELFKTEKGKLCKDRRGRQIMETMI
jgi:hypothetical protein